DHLCQRADNRRRGAYAVRRREGHRERPPRGWVGGLRVLFRDESLLRRLLGTAPAGADRYLRRVTYSTLVATARMPRLRTASAESKVRQVFCAAPTRFRRMRPMQVGSGKRAPSFDEGSLDQYLREISRYPLIAQDEEVTLAQRIRRGDQEALDK